MNEIQLPNEVMLNVKEAELLKRWIELLSAGSLSSKLGEDDWTVTRAEFSDADTFLAEMHFFRRKNPTEHSELCDAITGRSRVGVFQFQFSGTNNYESLPNHVVGRSLLVLTDELETVPIWSFESFVSR